MYYYQVPTTAKLYKLQEESIQCIKTFLQPKGTAYAESIGIDPTKIGFWNGQLYVKEGYVPEHLKGSFTKAENGYHAMKKRSRICKQWVAIVQEEYPDYALDRFNHPLESFSPRWYMIGVINWGFSEALKIMILKLTDEAHGQYGEDLEEISEIKFDELALAIKKQSLED